MHSLFIRSIALCLLLCLSPAGNIRVGEPETTALPASGDEAEQSTVEIVTDEQLDEGYLDEWFDGSVLVGDSLSAGFAGYVQSERYEKRPCLGDMTIVSASALTLKKALECEQKKRVPELKYRGRYMTIAEVVAATETKRLFIDLGVSDLRWYTPEEFIEAYDTLIGIVKESAPEVEIYVNSVVPMIESYAQMVNLTAEQNRDINQRLRAYCEEKGYGYVEMADPVRDENGYLDRTCSASDYRFHLNRKGKALWVRALRETARQAYYDGKWAPGGNG